METRKKLLFNKTSMIGGLLAIAILTTCGVSQAEFGRRNGGYYTGGYMVPVAPVYTVPAPATVYYAPPPPVTYYYAPPAPPVTYFYGPAPMAPQYTQPAPSDGLGKIKRYPRTKDFGNGVRGTLIDEEGEEERVTRHTGTNRGRYRLEKYIPRHKDEFGDWVEGHYEEVGEEELGQDLDEETGKRKTWGYRERGR